MVGFVLGLSAASCDEEDVAVEELTCEILSDPENCWARAAADAVQCLPPGGGGGVLNEDRTVCTFLDGSRVLFDEPLPLRSDELEWLAFTIESDGATCARFVDTFSNRMELEVGSNKAVAERHNAFRLTCQDEGVTYQIDSDGLFACEAGTQPTDAFVVQPDRVTVSIYSVSTPGTLFVCTTM